MPEPSLRASLAKNPAGGIQLRHLLNVPNILTLCRLGAIPILLAFLSKGRYTYALYVFALAAITDSLDGTVARLFDCKTEIGAFLDPFADKLMLLSTFIVLTIQEAFPGWLLGVLSHPRRRNRRRLYDGLVFHRPAHPGPSDYTR